MAIYSYTDSSGVKFNNLNSSPSPIKKVTGKVFNTNNDYEFANEGGIQQLTLDSILIDWNGAQVAGKTLNTTGEMLSILQTAYNYATTYTGKTSLTSSSVLGTINGQSLKFGGSITIETGSGSYYVLPPATNYTLGGVIVGDGLTVSNGKISLGTHSVNSNKYGIGDSTKYGHVRIDDYNGNEDSGAADTALSLLGANQIVSYINSYYTPKTSYTALYNAFVSLEQRVAALENSPTVPPTVTPGPSNIPVTSVAFKQDNYSLKGKNTHLTVKAYVLPSNANVGTTITYQTYSNGTSGTLVSSNNIISVSSTGLVTPKAVGTATVVATANSKTANTTITVSEADVTNVYVTGPTELTSKGQTITLTAYANPKDALFNTGVNWLSIPTAYSAYVSISNSNNTQAQIKCVSLPSENISVPVTATSAVKSSISKQYIITVKGNVVTPILQNITGAPTSYKDGSVVLGISNTSSFNSTSYFIWKIESTLGGSLEATADASTQAPSSSTGTITPGTSQSASTIINADLSENVIFYYPQNNSSSAVTHKISCTEPTTSARATIDIVVPAKPAEETKYFWYAGQTEPTSLTSNPTPSSTFTCNQWFKIGTTLPTSVVQQVTGGTYGNAWYAAMPTAAGLVAVTNADTRDTSITKEKTITINGVKYDVWYAGGVIASRYNLRFK